MATLFTEPKVNQANLADWQTLILKTTFVAGGFIALGLTDMDTTGAPKIARGSRVEVGGSIYKCSADEAVSGTASNNAVNYIYCVPANDGGSTSFSYSAEGPTWDSVNGGWYNGNKRAVAVFYLNNGLYFGKRTLGDSRDDLIPTEIGNVTTGGTLAESTNGTQKKEITLKKGFYRIELAGSKGGNGGAGSKPGGNGARGGYINITLYIERTVIATIFSAQKGANGQNGGYTDGSDDPDGRVGGGGGGGGGTAGFICISLLIALLVFGGGAGGGGGSGNTGSNRDKDWGGSGGGGGSGSGEDGTDGYTISLPMDYQQSIPGVQSKPGSGGDAGTRGKGGNGGKASRVNDGIAIPEGGAGYGDEYNSLMSSVRGLGGRGGKGGDGYTHAYTVVTGYRDIDSDHTEAITANYPAIPETAGEDGSPGGNSLNSEVGNAPSDDGFVKIYRVA